MSHEKCSHGVALFPKQDCRECEIVWKQKCIADAEESLRKHRARLAALTAAPTPAAPLNDEQLRHQRDELLEFAEFFIRTEGKAHPDSPTGKRLMIKAKQAIERGKP